MSPPAKLARLPSKQSTPSRQDPACVDMDVDDAHLGKPRVDSAELAVFQSTTFPLFAPQDRSYAPQDRSYAPQDRSYAPQDRSYAPLQIQGRHTATLGPMSQEWLNRKVIRKSTSWSAAKPAVMPGRMKRMASYSCHLRNGSTDGQITPRTPPAYGDALVLGPAAPHELLTADAFDLVLSLLMPHPDLFRAMRVCRGWNQAARLNYARREWRVPALPDALLAAVRAASPGDTVRVSAGVHSLSRELIIDTPLRILGPGDESGRHGKGGCEEAAGERADEGDAIITSDASTVLIRTRSRAKLSHLTLMRLGEPCGYPNATLLAEAAHLSLDRLRITCAAGSGGAGVAAALRSFDGMRLPTGGGSCGALAADPMVKPPSAAPSVPRDKPIVGLWVGAAASVVLRRSVISCTQGPAIKVNRGSVDIGWCDIGFSRLGANLVANGGSVRLTHSDVHGACGEGITAWNDAQISLQHNRICDNRGNGLAINSTGPRVAVELVGNSIAGNSRSGVMFNASVRNAAIKGNAFARNGSGDVTGVRPTEQSCGCAMMPPCPPPLVRVCS